MSTEINTIHEILDSVQPNVIDMLVATYYNEETDTKSMGIHHATIKKLVAAGVLEVVNEETRTVVLTEAGREAVEEREISVGEDGTTPTVFLDGQLVTDPAIIASVEHGNNGYREYLQEIEEIRQENASRSEDDQLDVTMVGREISGSNRINETRYCLCGCGRVIDPRKDDHIQFIQGHDATLKSVLIAIGRGEKTVDDIPMIARGSDFVERWWVEPGSLPSRKELRRQQRAAKREADKNS